LIDYERRDLPRGTRKNKRETLLGEKKIVTIYRAARSDLERKGLKAKLRKAGSGSFVP
jgi:hypothetical protein